MDEYGVDLPATRRPCHRCGGKADRVVKLETRKGWTPLCAACDDPDRPCQSASCHVTVSLIHEAYRIEEAPASFP